VDRLADIVGIPAGFADIPADFADIPGGTADTPVGFADTLADTVDIPVDTVDIPVDIVDISDLQRDIADSPAAQTAPGLVADIPSVDSQQVADSAHRFQRKDLAAQATYCRAPEAMLLSLGSAAPLALQKTGANRAPTNHQSENASSSFSPFVLCPNYVPAQPSQCSKISWRK
jgi:hypothetical protein